MRSASDLEENDALAQKTGAAVAAPPTRRALGAFTLNVNTAAAAPSLKQAALAAPRPARSDADADANAPEAFAWAPPPPRDRAGAAASTRRLRADGAALAAAAAANTALADAAAALDLEAAAAPPLRSQISSAAAPLLSKHRPGPASFTVFIDSAVAAEIDPYAISGSGCGEVGDGFDDLLAELQ